jgi:hypothetical protein
MLLDLRAPLPACIAGSRDERERNTAAIRDHVCRFRKIVIPGLFPGSHLFARVACVARWVPGTRPGMTAVVARRFAGRGG